MKILVVGNPKDIYIFSYIKYILSYGSFSKIYIWNVSHNMIDIKQEIRAYYDTHNIEIITTNYKNLFYKIPLLSQIIKLIACRKALIDLGSIDFCHVHGVGTLQAFTIASIAKQFKSIIATYWGSDLLRSNKYTRFIQKRIISKAKYITVSTEHMKETFLDKFEPEYKSKLRMIKIGLASLDHIMKLAEKESINDVKKRFSFPKDRIIVVCGYNGNKAQQHLKILSSIDKCDKSIKDKIYLVIPMTYGVSDTSYIEETMLCLTKYQIKGEILRDYLGLDDMARLWMGTDIMIHMQLTDAISGSVQENLFLNNIVINGGWLDYKELKDKNAYYHEVADTKDIADKLSYITRNLEEEKKKCTCNSAIIKEMSLWENLREQWLLLYGS